MNLSIASDSKRKLMAEYDSTGVCQKDYIYMGIKLLAEYQPIITKAVAPETAEKISKGFSKSINAINKLSGDGMKINEKKIGRGFAAISSIVNVFRGAWGIYSMKEIRKNETDL